MFREGAALLERLFADLLDRCDIPAEEYAAHTRRLIVALDEEAGPGSAPGAALAEPAGAPMGWPQP
jgi:hypothetical protein